MHKKRKEVKNIAYGKAGDWYINSVEGGGGEFKIADITWVNLPATFDDPISHARVFLLTKTADGFEDYYGIYEFGEDVLVWDDEWHTSPHTVVTSKQPENIGDLATWLQPFENYNFSVVSGDAFIWNRGVIIYGNCTLTIS